MPVTSAVTVPETQAVRPAPLAASDGEIRALSPVRETTAPGPAFCPSGSGTNVSACAATVDIRTIATAATAVAPAMRAPRTTDMFFTLKAIPSQGISTGQLG